MIDKINCLQTDAQLKAFNLVLMKRCAELLDLVNDKKITGTEKQIVIAAFEYSRDYR